MKKPNPPSSKPVPSSSSSSNNNNNNNSNSASKPNYSPFKIFVGGVTNLSDNLEEVLKNHFSQYGTVIAVEQPAAASGFAFITLAESEVVSKLLAKQWEVVLGRQVELKPYALSASSSPFLQKKDEVMRSVLNIPMKAEPLLPVDELKNPGMLEAGKSHTWNIRIRNNSTSDKTITNILFLVSKPEFQVVDISSDTKRGVKKTPFVLERGSVFSFGVMFNPRHRFHGTYRAPLAVCFKDFYTLKEIVIKVTDPAILQTIVPTVQTRYVAPVIDEIQRTIIPAFPPSRGSSTHFHTPVETPYVVPIPEYPIPENVQNPVDSGRSLSSSNFWKNKENHISRLHNLLYIEEAQQKKNLRKFDLREVTMDIVTEVMMGRSKQPPPEPCMRLLVPGLAEQRPSVLTGDSVYAWVVGTEDFEYEGMVWRVEEKAVLLMFCVDFEYMFSPGTKFNVRFSFNRMHMRYMHRAVDATDLSIIWPSSSLSSSGSIREELAKGKRGQLTTSQNGQLTQNGKSSPTENGDRTIKKYFDTDIKNNEAQKKAVEAVAFGLNKHVPFLLFGSFGTGKTKTLVEMVKQVLAHAKEPRILICAKVNSAADLFIEKLASTLSPKEMFRLLAFHRKIETVPAQVQTYTKITQTRDKDIFDVPRLADLLNYKVIITTTMTSATLYGIGVGNSHFSHIFIDEAAQTMEPEALIPLAMAKYGQTCIIMSGDDQQLGPKVYSPSCRHHGLDQSIMERLVTQSSYGNRSDSSVCVSLFTIYRSHPLISALPSSLYYGGKLVSKVDPNKVTLNWHSLGNNFPVFFYGVEGQDAQEGDSPSFFNPEEALALVTFVQNMIQEVSVLEREICIISAYSKQIKVIRDLLRQYKMYNVNVGGVDEMQGREFKVVLISTVRARQTWHMWKQFDTQHQLGFVGDPKRLNTAITRAQSLLIFVGDPYVLYRDPSFKYIIKYCIDNGSYQNVALKQVQEWQEAPLPSSSQPSATLGPNDQTGNGGPNGPSGPSGPPKPSITAKSPAKPQPPDDNATNQENEDVFVAAARVLTQHKSEPKSSKAASVAMPAQAEVQEQHKDAILRVLGRFFDPKHSASGRDPAALAPLFAQSEVAGYSEELAHLITTAGTQVGREESVRACGVLKVLSEQVPNLPDVLAKIISEHLVILKGATEPSTAHYTGIFLANVFTSKLVSLPHTLFVHLVPSNEKQNNFLADILVAMAEVMGQEEVKQLIDDLKWDLSRIFNKPLLALAKFLKDKRLQFLTPEHLPETRPLNSAKSTSEVLSASPLSSSPRANSPVVMRANAPAFRPSASSPVPPTAAAAAPPSTPLYTPFPTDNSTNLARSLASINAAAEPEPATVPPPSTSSSSSSSSPFASFAEPAPSLPLPGLPAQPPLPANLPPNLFLQSPYANFPFNHSAPGAFNPALLAQQMQYPLINPNFPPYLLNSFANPAGLNNMYNPANLQAANLQAAANLHAANLQARLMANLQPLPANLQPFNLHHGNLQPELASLQPDMANLQDTTLQVANNSENADVLDLRGENEVEEKRNLSDSTDAGLDCLYEYGNEQLIVVKSGSTCPPLSVLLEGANLKIEICVYNLDVNITQTGNLVYIDVAVSKERGKQTQFMVPTLRSLNGAPMKSKRNKESTRIIVGIPSAFHPAVETKKGDYVLILLLKPRPFPMPERIIPSVLDDSVK